MRGRQEPQVTMLAFVDLEERVPADHPLRTIKVLADEALARLSPEFDRMYADVGRPSIPPERLLKASLLIALFSVRSERAFCEELDDNLLFRWFLGMQLMERSFDATVFTKNRQRLLEHRVGQQLFDEVVLAADRRSLLSDEHFTVDGTLIEAAASLKSFKPRDGRSSPRRRRPGQPLGGLSWGPARERDAPERDGPRGETLPEGEREGGQAGVHGPCADGEPQRPARGLPGERSDGDGGAGCGSGAAGRGARTRFPSPDARRGQGLRHAGLRGGHARPRGHPARGAKH